MKVNLVVLLLLLACISNAETILKPTGEQALSAFFSALDVYLSSETLCDVGAATNKKEKLKLRDYLATILSTSYDSQNVTSIQADCSESKHEGEEGVVDIWDCKLMINETSSEGRFVSSSILAFGLDKKEVTYLSGTLRCI